MKCIGIPKHSAVAVLSMVSAAAHVNQNANALYRPSCVSTWQAKARHPQIRRSPNHDTLARYDLMTALLLYTR